jgi:hypothetical protein
MVEGEDFTMSSFGSKIGIYFRSNLIEDGDVEENFVAQSENHFLSLTYFSCN